MEIQLKNIMWTSFLLGYKTKAGNEISKKEEKIAKKKFNKIFEMIK